MCDCIAIFTNTMRNRRTQTPQERRPHKCVKLSSCRSVFSESSPLPTPACFSRVGGVAATSGRQERAIAPFLATTSKQTFRKPSAQAAATRCACCERQTARTRALNAVFPKAGRPARRSSRSRWRNRFRSHAQNFSIGFKSGDLGGTDHRMTFAAAWAAALSRVRSQTTWAVARAEGEEELDDIPRYVIGILYIHMWRLST